MTEPYLFMIIVEYLFKEYGREGNSELSILQKQAVFEASEVSLDL